MKIPTEKDKNVKDEVAKYWTNTRVVDRTCYTMFIWKPRKISLGQVDLNLLTPRDPFEDGASSS